MKDQFHTSQEQKSVVFDDSWEHEVYNERDGMRVVLIVDFLRPMTAPLYALNYAIVHGLAPHTEESRQILDQIEKHS